MSNVDSFKGYQVIEDKIPSEWKKLKKLQVKKEFKLPDKVLFRFERFGHRNGTAGIPRVYQALAFALCLTCVGVLAVTFVDAIVNSNDFLTIFKDVKLSKTISFGGSVFAFVAALEIGSYYQKWKYLAELFNSVIKLEAKPVKTRYCDHYSQREHLAACLASDVVCMEMWNHRSFLPFLKETIEKAVLVEAGFDEAVFTMRLACYAKGIDDEELERLLSNYIDWNRPFVDRIGALAKSA